MAATPWRSAGAAAAEPSATTVSSTPSHKFGSVFIGPTIAEKRVVFQAYLFPVHPRTCRRGPRPSRRNAEPPFAQWLDLEPPSAFYHLSLVNESESKPTASAPRVTSKVLPVNDISRQRSAAADTIPCVQGMV